MELIQDIKEGYIDCYQIMPVITMGMGIVSLGFIAFWCSIVWQIISQVI